jgi:hypothetical protein
VIASLQETEDGFYMTRNAEGENKESLGSDGDGTENNKNSNKALGIRITNESVQYTDNETGEWFDIGSGSGTGVMIERLI